MSRTMTIDPATWKDKFAIKRNIAADRELCAVTMQRAQGNISYDWVKLNEIGKALPHYIDRAEAAEQEALRLADKLADIWQQVDDACDRLGLPHGTNISVIADRCATAEARVKELEAGIKAYCDTCPVYCNPYCPINILA